MDELYDQLQTFIYTLGRFNEQLGSNWDQLQGAWARADELWDNDATRLQFEGLWREMGDALRIYRQEHGEAYEKFLETRKWDLDAYFGRR